MGLIANDKNCDERHCTLIFLGKDGYYFDMSLVTACIRPTGASDDIGFKAGDVVMLLNADEIEIAAGRNIRTDCTWEHSKITELQGSVVTIKSIGRDMEYRCICDQSNRRPRIVRKIINIETDDGKVIGCHPEWLQLLKSYDEQDTTDLDALFEEFSV